MGFTRATLEVPELDEHIDWVVRPMEVRDDNAYRAMMEAEPQSGWITIDVHYKGGQSPYELLTQRRLQQVFVVEVPPGKPDSGKVVGAAACDPRRIWFEKQPIQAVHLHGLFVHPSYRHQGIATELVKARVHWAREVYGRNVLMFAELHQDNMASLKAAAKWATEFTQPRESGFLLARKHMPSNPHNYEVREAVEADYTCIVQGLNQFNHDVDFTRVVDADRLHRNLSPIKGQIFRHRYVVLEDGEIVGGAVLSMHDPSVETRMIRARPVAQVVARLSGMIHEAGEVNYGEVDGIWFNDGHANASHYLVDVLLYKAKLDTTTTDALNFTVINPKVWESVQLPRWQPHTIQCVAYLAPPILEPLQNVEWTPA